MPVLLTLELAIAFAEASSSKLPCQHPGTFGNMCIVCGQNVEEEETGLSFTYIHKVLRQSIRFNFLLSVDHQVLAIVENVFSIGYKVPSR